MMNVSGKIYKLERNSIWLLLFHHDVTIGEFFYSRAESKKCFNYTKGKYSILYTLNNEYRINEKFEFLLEYPEINKSNQWRQSNNPLHQTFVGNENVTGYEPINIQLSESHWHGLHKVNNEQVTLLAGSYNGDWFYSIGTVSKEFSPCFPGPGTKSKIVSLWVKIRGEPNKCTFRQRRRLISLFSVVIYISFIVS